MNNAEMIYDGGSIVLIGGSHNLVNVVTDVNLANSFFIIHRWKELYSEHIDNDNGIANL